MNQWQLTTSERAALLDFLRRLVQTPSLSGEEQSIAELLVAEMRTLGFHHVRRDAAGNVLGELGTGDGPLLLLDSHMDTVSVSTPETWDRDPWSAELRDGELYGLGSCDMKGGLAATIYGAAHLLHLGVPLTGRVLVGVVGLEEPCEGVGTRVLFEEDGIAPDWVVIAEPSNLQVIRAQRGHQEMSLSVAGRSAHSAAPQLGENAIYNMARILFGLEILSEQLTTDSFLGAGVLAVTNIHSRAVSRNAIPEFCEITIDRRLTLGETETSALNEIQHVLSREGVTGHVEVIEEEITTYTGKTYPVRRTSLPWAFEAEHPLIQAMVAAARQVGGQPKLEKWPFATEGAYTAGVAQVPTVGFGPGDPALAHTSNEHIPVAQVYAAAGAYAALAGRLLGGASD
ncbi:MAG: YgeY family selenium metabolism-linked hydrolase [Chloroflexota bacterium]|nr:YgeY family selenium metabolism-linked hydrolase [Chloroflexota bacterium]